MARLSSCSRQPDHMVDEGSHLRRDMARLRVKRVVVPYPGGVGGKNLNQLATCQIGLNGVPRKRGDARAGQRSGIKRGDRIQGQPAIQIDLDRCATAGCEHPLSRCIGTRKAQQSPPVIRLAKPSAASPQIQSGNTV